MEYKSLKLTNPEYNRDELSQTWSESPYEKYKTNQSTWGWRHFPLFNNKKDIFSPPSEGIDGSILEIGSAAGGAYSFLKSVGAIDSSHDYTGYDISKMGHDYCINNYPDAKWHLGDVTKKDFTNMYDYSFERIAVHHMPNPLAIFSKMLKVTRKSFACGFVSCLNGSTISDLDKARYRHGGGEFVYFDIINLFEVIEVMLDEKFNRINIYYGGEHEQVHHDTLAHQYISPEINVRDRLVGRSTVICSKTDGPVKIELVNQNKSLMSIARSMKKKIFREADHLKVIEDRIKLMHNRSYGILYKSEYQPY